MVASARALTFLGLLYRVAGDAVRLPRIGSICTICTAHDADLLRDHEGRIEPDAELADDVHIGALVLSVLLFELLGARMGDCAEVLVEIFLGHADTVIGDHDGAGILIEGKTDGKGALVHLHIRVREALEAQLVDSIRCIRDELAEEDLLVRIDGIDHEIEKLLALSLELFHMHPLTLLCRTAMSCPLHTFIDVPAENASIQDEA